MSSSDGYNCLWVMKLISAVKNRILQLCEQNNLTVNGLAERCGMPPSSLKAILYGRSKNPTIRIIKIICDGLNMTLSEFFKTEEFDNLEQEIK